MRKNLITVEIFLFTLLILLASFWALDSNGNYEPVLVILGVVLSIIEFYRRFRKEKEITEKQTKLPLDILTKIEPKTSVERMKDILGASHSIQNDRIYFPIDADSTIETTTYRYEFKNAIIEFDSEDSISIDTISLFKYFDEDIFEVAYINDLGIISIGDIESEYGLENLDTYTGGRYAVMAIQCESDRTGFNYYYTFGCIENDDIYGAKLVDGKLYSRDNKVLNTSNLICDFVSISHKENYGHPPYLLIFD